VEERSLSWTLNYGGHTWRSDDMKVATLIAIGEYVGKDDWTVMKAVTSPQILGATLVVLLAQTEQVPLEVAQQVVFDMTVTELLETITLG
jgi:hypothetical protein